MAGTETFLFFNSLKVRNLIFYDGPFPKNSSPGKISLKFPTGQTRFLNELIHRTLFMETGIYGNQTTY